MTMYFVLIMVFGGATSQSGMSTITQEFNSFDACESARIHISMSVTATSLYASSGAVRSMGCYKR